MPRPGARSRHFDVLAEELVAVGRVVAEYQTVSATDACIHVERGQEHIRRLRDPPLRRVEIRERGRTLYRGSTPRILNLWLRVGRRRPARRTRKATPRHGTGLFATRSDRGERGTCTVASRRWRMTVTSPACHSPEKRRRAAQPTFEVDLPQRSAAGASRYTPAAY